MYEFTKDKKNGWAKNRKIELELLANLTMEFMAFVYPSRQKKTRADSLMECMFDVLALKHPELFMEEMEKLSNIFQRKNKFHAWKIPADD